MSNPCNPLTNDAILFLSKKYDAVLSVYLKEPWSNWGYLEIDKIWMLLTYMDLVTQIST